MTLKTCTPLKLMVRQRQGKLFGELDLSGLELWPPELADSIWQLLAEYHDVFSLEPMELGCTHSTKHVLKVTDVIPFKEWFRRIPLPLVEEVCNHLWRCWMQVPYDPVRVHGVMQFACQKEEWRLMLLYWLSTTLMPIQRRNPTPCQEFRRH